MYISSEGLLIILFVGLVAGWLAGQIVQGTGLGLLGDLLFGVLGAFVGSWFLPKLIPAQLRRLLTWKLKFRFEKFSWRPHI